MYDGFQNWVNKWDQNTRTLLIFILISRQFIMSIAEGKFELDLMRGYEESFRQRMTKLISLSYDCLPLNPEDYSQKVSEVLQSMKSIDPNEKDISQHDQIILGKIEGQPASTNFKQVVESVVGEVSEEKFKAYLKQKTQQRNYGVSTKDKNCSIRQVKKLQTLKKYFDVNQITKKRKYNKFYSASIKSLAKYFELYTKIDENDSTTIMKAFQQYNTYIKDDKKFALLVKQQDESKNIADKPVVIEEAPLQKQPEQEGIIEEEHKIAEVKQLDKQSEQKKSANEEVKTPKKQRSKKKQNKAEDAILPEINSADATQKDKAETEQKKQEKEKNAKEKQKTVKKPNNKLLTEFFAIKKKETPQAPKNPFIDESNKPIATQGTESIDSKAQPTAQAQKKKSIWETFYQPQQDSSLPAICSLRQQFRAFRMQNQQYTPEPYYTNIVITLSTIEYYDYFMTPNRDVEFGQPFRKIWDVMYFEDESEEFEGESANEDVEDQEAEDEDQLSEGNHTILSDDHLSNEELSSCEVDQIELKVEYGKGRKWIMNFVSRYTSMQSEDQLELYNSFSMICLQTDQTFPLRLDQEEESSEFIMTPELWRDVYRQAHGYYGTKDAIIKDVSAILPGVSKNWIDSMLKERTEKVLNQRFVKKDFVDDIKEKIPQIDTLLEKMLEERNEELRKIKAEKNQQKDLKLQKDILECTGSRYIVNLIKQLKEKGYKQMRRNQLIEFINERKGEEWQKIKAEMNTMSRPIAQMIRNMPVSERIDEQVEMDDDEYKKMQLQKVKQNDANSDPSTKEKIEGIFGNGELQKKKKKKDKKDEEVQEDMKSKMKKRKDKKNNLPNIYTKTKPINRARKTKNSLKTGIPSIEQLKKQKQEQKLKNNQQGDEQENAEQNDSENQQNGGIEQQQQREQQEQNQSNKDIENDRDIGEIEQKAERLQQNNEAKSEQVCQQKAFETQKQKQKIQEQQKQQKQQQVVEVPEIVIHLVETIQNPEVKGQDQPTTFSSIEQ